MKKINIYPKDLTWSKENGIPQDYYELDPSALVEHDKEVIKEFVQELIKDIKFKQNLCGCYGSILDLVEQKGITL